LNTRLRGQAAAVLAHQLFIVLDRRLPAGLGQAQLSDRPEGSSPFLTRPDQNLVGTISSDGGNVDIVVERVDRGRGGLLWLFSSNTLSAIPRLYEENDAIAIEDVIPKFLVAGRTCGNATAVSVHRSVEPAAQPLGWPRAPARAQA
jgi:hypothetical protein